MIGRWLCRHNWHRLILAPPVPPGRRISGHGIPEHAYLLDMGDGRSIPPGKMTFTASGTTFIVATQRPICSRCLRPL